MQQCNKLTKQQCNLDLCPLPLQVARFGSGSKSPSQNVIANCVSVHGVSRREAGR